MGLSGRRRARKEPTLSRTAHNPLPDAVEEPQSCHSAYKRTGNTYRRAMPKTAREMTRINLLAFNIRRGFQTDLFPPRLGPRQEAGVLENRNVSNTNQVRIMENDFSVDDVTYSLNKRHRWSFLSDIRGNYEVREELKKQNIFLSEAEATGHHRGGSVRKLTTNAYYMVEAATELRAHEKKLKVRYKVSPKQQVDSNDRFKFTDQVTKQRTDRPLRTLSSVAGGSINAKSIERSCNLWNNLYNVSPNAEKVRQELQSDYDARMEVFIGTCAPSPRVNAKRCRQIEKENYDEKQGDKSENRIWKKEIDDKKKFRCFVEVHLEKDGRVDDVPDVADDTAELESLDSEAVCKPRPPLLFNVMRTKTNISANQIKKLAIKLRKKEIENKRTKLRKESNITVESSGYDSDCESQEQHEVQLVTEDNQKANARLSEAVCAAVTTERPIVKLMRETSVAESLNKLFGGCAQALVVGKSEPMKLAVLLQPDLSENVVFEEVAQQDPMFTIFKVFHTCSSERNPRTSADEVASMVNPFAFLRDLVSQSDATAVEMQPEAEKARISEPVMAGWKNAKVLAEPDARLAAVRALPMFSVTTESTVGQRELELVLDCEICCKEMSQAEPKAKLFSEGFTRLNACGHQFCNQCWLQHVASTISGGRAAVVCPGYKCQCPVDAATLLWFCPAELLSALAAAAFRLWLTEPTDARQRRFCALKNCGRLLESPRGVNSVCGACQVSLCLGCGQEPHWPADCATAAEYRKKMEHLGHRQLMKIDVNSETDVNAKQCPTCRLVMEKGYGCNHMQCPCGVHFCWWCGQTMGNHRAGPCANQSSGRAQSDFRVQRVFNAKDSFLTPTSSQSRMYCNAVKARWLREYTSGNLTSTKKKVKDLFLSYTIRFFKGGGGISRSRSAKLEADRAAEQLIECVIQATFLVEHSYAHLDRHPAKKLVKTAARMIGGHVNYLVETVHSELQQQSSIGFRGPRQTKLMYEKLMMLQRCLRGTCHLLYRIIVNHKETRGIQMMVLRAQGL